MKGEKQLQMANKADSSANGKANPYSHPACTFAGKTSGCIDFRLQYKLYSLNLIHLAIFNIILHGVEGRTRFGSCDVEVIKL